MTKADIVTEISNKTGIDRNDVLAIVEGMMSTVKNAMENGENVYLRGFGSFIVKKRAEKLGRNIWQKQVLQSLRIISRHSNLPKNL